MVKKYDILLVGSDLELNRQIQGELAKSKLDLRLEVAQAPKEWSSALHHFTPNLLILAAPGPDMKALALIREQLPHTPVLVVSGSPAECATRPMAGAAEYRQVSVDQLHQLSSVVKEILQESVQVPLPHELPLEEQLRKLVDLSLDIICTLDQHGRFVTVSTASKLLLDYWPEEVMGQLFTAIVHQDDQEKAQSALQGLMHGIDIINQELCCLRRNGSAVTLLWSVRWDHEHTLAFAVAKDISAIKKAEDHLRRKERRFRAILQNCTDGLALVNERADILELSTSARKVIGVGEDEPFEQIRFELVHPDDLPFVAELWEQMRARPNAFELLEFRFMIPGKGYRWLEASVHNQLHDPDIEGIVLNFRDIHERKQIEIALRNREANLKEAQALGHVGSWELNLTNGEATWSDEMYRILGVKKEDCLPSLDTLLSFVHPEDRQAVMNQMQQDMAACKTSQIFFRIVRPNGEMRYLTVNARYDFDSKGNPIGLFGVQQDITALKSVELALEQSEEKYRNLFNLSPIPMWVYEVQELRFIDVNEAAVKHYGYSRDEFLQMSLLDIRTEDNINDLKASIEKALQGEGFKLDVVQHKKKDGELIQVEVYGNFIVLNENKSRLAVVSDVTDKVNYIQAIEMQNQKLREIAWIQSHKVRAPLARIMGLVNLLNSTPVEEQELHRLLHLVQNSAVELDKIIREIVHKAEQVKGQ